MCEKNSLIRIIFACFCDDHFDVIPWFWFGVRFVLIVWIFFLHRNAIECCLCCFFYSLLFFFLFNTLHFNSLPFIHLKRAIIFGSTFDSYYFPPSTQAIFFLYSSYLTSRASSSWICNLLEFFFVCQFHFLFLVSAEAFALCHHFSNFS